MNVRPAASPAGEKPTVRQVIRRLAGARGHWVLAGTPATVADAIETWFASEAADRFNIMPPTLPSSFEAFTAEVVPILRRRGLFREDYSGATLREHYGLPRPVSGYTQARLKSA